MNLWRENIEIDQISGYKFARINEIVSSLNWQRVADYNNLWNKSNSVNTTNSSIFFLFASKMPVSFVKCLKFLEIKFHVTHERWTQFFFLFKFSKYIWSDDHFISIIESISLQLFHLCYFLHKLIKITNNIFAIE